MVRPTIRDLAEAAGVSIATVNRVIGGSGRVKQPTMQRIMDAAEAIGFYGLGAIGSRVAAARIVLSIPDADEPGAPMTLSKE